MIDKRMAAEIRCTADPREIVQVLSKLTPAEGIDENRITRQILLDPNFCEEGSLLLEESGDFAGYCWAVRRKVPLENATDDRDRGYVVLFACSSAEEGRVLLSHAEEFLKGRGCSSIWVSPYAPGYFTPGLDEAAYPEAADLLRITGYEPKSRPLSMKLDLAELHPPSHVLRRRNQVEHTFEFQSFQRWLTVPLLRFAEREFAGDWVRFARDAARAILRGEDPGRLQIALQNGQVIGFSHYEGGRFGPIGVSKQAEGQGAGSILMLRTLESMQAAGQEEAWFLWTDDRTAERFYIPWGWREWRRFTIFAKNL